MSEITKDREVVEVVVTPEEIAALRAASPWWEWKLHTDEEMREVLVKERKERKGEEQEGVRREEKKSEEAKLIYNGLKLIRRMKFTIGGVKKDELLERFKESGNIVSDWALEIINKRAFTTLLKPVEIELGWIRVADLGFDRDPSFNELFTRIKEVGNLCLAEVGLHLKLMDVGALYLIAMETIIDSMGQECIFWHYNDSLYAWGLGSVYCNRTKTIVFVLRH